MAALPHLSVGGAQPDAEHLVAGQVNADVPVNSMADLLDGSMNGTIDIDCTAGGTITLTADQWTRNYRFRLTGTPAAAFTVATPASNRRGYFENTAGQDSTIQVTGGGGDSVTLRDGGKRPIFCDSTHITSENDRTFLFPGVIAGAPSSGTEIAAHLFAIPVTFKAGLPLSVAKCGTAPSAQTVFDIRKDGGSIGSLTFAASSTSGVFAMASDQSFVSLNEIQIVSPGALNGLQDLKFTIVGESS